MLVLDARQGTNLVPLSRPTPKTTSEGERPGRIDRRTRRRVTVGSRRGGRSLALDMVLDTADRGISTQLRETARTWGQRGGHRRGPRRATGITSCRSIHAAYVRFPQPGAGASPPVATSRRNRLTISCVIAILRRGPVTFARGETYSRNTISSSPRGICLHQTLSATNTWPRPIVGDPTPVDHGLWLVCGKGLNYSERTSAALIARGFMQSNVSSVRSTYSQAYSATCYDARRGGPTPRCACHTASTLTSSARGT